MKISAFNESYSRPVVIGSGKQDFDLDRVISSVRQNLKVDGDTPAEVLQKAIDLLTDRPQTRMSQSILGDIERIVKHLKVPVGAFHYRKLQHAVESKLSDVEPINEVNMSPSALAQFAKDADKYGVRAGFEAELLFTRLPPQGEGGESEPDYEGNDERIRSNTTLDDLQDFFSETVDRSNRVWARMEEDYLDAVYEKAQEFADENIDERVRERVLDELSEDDRLYNYLTSNGHSDEDIEKIIAAGNDAPQFTRSSEETAYAEENQLYKFWKEAQDAVEEELETEMDRLRDEVEEELRDEFMGDNEYYIGEWLNDNNIDYMSELSSEWELYWPHWTENTEYEGFDEYEMRSAAEELEERVGMDVRVSGGYHNATRNDNTYIIEPDGSLEPDDPSEHASAEIVSPPMPLDQMINHVKEVFAWAKEYGGYTNTSTGLHVGVSLPDMSKIDYVKLALLMGDEYVLKTFGREMNTYCKGVFKQIAQNRNEQTVAQAVDALKTGMIGVASTALKYSVFKSSGTTDKYVSANWKNQYIEFRSMGGDYIDNIDKIVNTVYRYVRAMVSAADPDMDRREYLSKLYKLVQQANADIKSPDAIEPVNMLITKYLAGQLDKNSIKQYTQYFKQVAVSRKNPGAEKPEHPAGPLQRWRVKFDRRGVEVMVKARNAEGALELAKKQNSTIARASDDELTVTSMGVVNPPAPAPDQNNNTSTSYEIVYRGSNPPGRRFVFVADSPEQAQRKYSDWLAAQGLPPETEDYGYRQIAMAGSTLDLQRQRSQQTGSSSGEFTGWWKILDGSGRELHRFNGIGNSQADANRIAAGWLGQNRPNMAGQEVSVVPVMN